MLIKKNFYVNKIFYILKKVFEIICEGKENNQSEHA